MLRTALRQRTQRLALKIDYDSVPITHEHLAEMIVAVVTYFLERRDLAEASRKALNQFIALRENLPGKILSLWIKPCRAKTVKRRRAWPARQAPRS